MLEAGWPLAQEKEKTVSVIIPLGPPRRQTLLTLKSIVDDQYPFKEIILVGNTRYKEQYKDLIALCRDVNLRFVIYGSERSEQKNYGAMIASSDYILFIDDDMIIEPNLILECFKALSENHADAVVIPQKIIPISFLGKIKKIGCEIKGTYEPVIAPRFIKKNVFLKIGGYDPTLVFGEDVDLAMRFILYHFKYTKVSKSIRYIVDESIVHYLGKYIYYGRRAKKYIIKLRKIYNEKYITILQSHILPLDPIYFSNMLRSFCNSRLMTFNFIILKLLEMCCFLMGLLFSVVISHE